MKVVREPIAAHMTPRKCCVCPEPAVFSACKLSDYLKNGKQTVDKSSRRFFCETHGQPKAA